MNEIRTLLDRVNAILEESGGHVFVTTYTKRDADNVEVQYLRATACDYDPDGYGIARLDQGLPTEGCRL